MPVPAQPFSADLDALLTRVGTLKVASKENVPPSSHPTAKVDDNTSPPTKGPTATEKKQMVADAAQSNPVDGSKLGEGNATPEHGIDRMLSDEKVSGVSVGEADNNPKKMASLSDADLYAKSAELSTRIAAKILVDSAGEAQTKTAGAQPAAAAAPSTTPAAPTQTPASDVQKAAAAGAEAAERMARQLVVNTIREGQLAADLMHKFAGISKASQLKAAAALKIKKADAGPPMPPPGPTPGPGAMPVPDGNSGPEMPPEAAAGDPGAGGGGGMPPGMGGGDMGGGAPPIDPSKLTPEQIEQLLMALMETQGHSDPKALEESADPAAASMGKQARSFLKSGKFELGKPKTAAQRQAINHMKQFLLETSR